MKRSGGKNAKLRERIRQLQQESEQVEASIRRLDRAIQAPDSDTTARRLRGLSERPTQEPHVPASAPVVPPPPARPIEVPTAPGGDDFSDEDLGGGMPKMTANRRFASYFVTGSLHSVRPLRTERRIQRNKAIFLLFIAAALIYGVFSVVF